MPRLIFKKTHNLLYRVNQKKEWFAAPGAKGVREYFPSKLDQN